jgi:hypothetical protein
MRSSEIKNTQIGAGRSFTTWIRHYVCITEYELCQSTAAAIVAPESATIEIHSEVATERFHEASADEKMHRPPQDRHITAAVAK